MGVHCLDNKIIYAGGRGTLSGPVIYHFDSKESFKAIKLQIRGKAYFSYQDDKDTVHVQEKFLADEVATYGDKGQCEVMSPGTYAFNFRYILFSKLPSSYTYYNSQTPSEIKYTIKVKRHTTYVIHNDAIQEFYVVKYIDLNDIPEANQHFEFNMIKDTIWLCCASRPFIITTRLERKGFIPGKKIPLFIECDKRSTYPAIEIIVYLRLIINLYNHKLNQKTLYRRVPTLITLSELSFGSNACDTKTWKRDMEIPRIQPLYAEGCKIIDIHYSLCFKVRFQFPYRDLTGKIPVSLGNVPIGDEFDLLSEKLLIVNNLKELRKFKITQKFNGI